MIKIVRTWLHQRRSFTEVIERIYKLDEAALAKLTYDEHIINLQAVVRLCQITSRQYGGIISKTSQHAHASVLFTTLCVKGQSLLNVLPRVVGHKNHHDHWDFPSIASITRSIMEARLAFYYLCIESISREEWECRWNIMNLHDCSRRISLFEGIDPEGEDYKFFIKTKKELQERLNKNNFFQNLIKDLPEKKKKEYLSGRNAYLEPLESIAEKVGFPQHQFKWEYLLLSNQVHSLPMSYYRMIEGDWGRGIYSQRDEQYSIMCIGIVTAMLLSAKDEMNTLFLEQQDSA